MIEFSCNCGQYKFSLPDDMAGGLIQCPRCRRLNDIPSLSDLPNLDEDGAYKLEPQTEKPPSDEVLAKMNLAYTKGRFDEDGNEIDLRAKPADIRRIGNPDDKPFELRDEVSMDRPKYDPDTGELIRPIDVKADNRVDPKKVPIAGRAGLPAKPVVIDSDTPGVLDVLKIPMQLLKPANLIVMGFILLFHVFGMFIIAVTVLGMWLVTLMFPVLHALLLAHYGNVIDETGPTRRNDLPTPLRNLSWHDDTWGPFVRMLMALALCYWPALITLFPWLLPWPLRAMAPLLPWAIRMPLGLGLAAVGSVAVPAAMLTGATSGSYLNLRPDRLVKVMGICGAEYAASMLLWCVTATIYSFGAFVVYVRTAAFVVSLLTSASPVAPAARATRATTIDTILTVLFSWPVAFASLLVGIYLAHLFCWHLGTFYRRYHERFPWLYQRYERDARNRPAPRRGFAVQRKLKPKPSLTRVDAPVIPRRPPREIP